MGLSSKIFFLREREKKREEGVLLALPDRKILICVVAVGGGESFEKESMIR